ncbi:DNA-binding transcriptional regulator, LacI/PurR family [Abditibacterium utsteinense]|uniref:DNA-binding transcriptional regulator, LacI/PurR family n=1 Tax=Abditibacterium utsteinense TaxID=1960156 RepID=A0A2S8SWA3_9BACT|nr:GntR family transcriptional regulator [Abditibacterium utsteinense]PQV65068.1 DNA-binding transcriptional regulator, LacI/PurR family [Abditibacterium utsteinense]
MPPKKLAYATKTQALSTHISALAYKLGPGAKLPTMQQLSTELGISVMTLNRALSELEAQNIVVRRQGSGTYVNENLGVKTVGLVYDRALIGASASPFAALLLEEAGRRAHQHGEKFSLYLSEPAPSGLPVHEDLSEDIRERKMSGLLLMSGHSAAISWLLKQKLPLVSLSYLPLTPFRVRIWHAQTAYLGALELAKRGAQKIGLWIPAGVGIGRAKNEDSFEELDFFRRALEESDLKFDPKLVHNLENLSHELKAGPSNQAQGLNAANQVFAGKNRPDGIVILDDMMTRGALTAISQLGIVPGRDVQIASHTNVGSQVLFGYEKSLTFLEIDPSKVAEAMFEMLETLMRGDVPEHDVVSIAPTLRA